MNESQPSAAMRSSGSEKRRRVHKVDTRWDAIEHASLAAAAQTTGLTKGAYVRALVLGCPGPRSQRAPSVNALALAEATVALNKATGAINKVGGNINQIARVLNSGGAHVTTKEYLAALRDVRVALAGILEIVGRHP
jgi:Bacterial mobilisation protein (MobC)